MEHDMKILPPYFEAVASGRKAFEVRRDDRGFAEGDTLRLREWVPRDEVGLWPYQFVAKGDYTGREARVRVTYLLRGEGMNRFGLQSGYVVMGIEAADAATREAVVRRAAAEAGLRVLSSEQADWMLQDGSDLTMPDAQDIVAALRGEEASR